MTNHDKRRSLYGRVLLARRVDMVRDVKGKEQRLQRFVFAGILAGPLASLPKMHYHLGLGESGFAEFSIFFHYLRSS